MRVGDVGLIRGGTLAEFAAGSGSGYAEDVRFKVIRLTSDPSEVIGWDPTEVPWLLDLDADKPFQESNDFLDRGVREGWVVWARPSPGEEPEEPYTCPSCDGIMTPPRPGVFSYHSCDFPNEGGF